MVTSSEAALGVREVGRQAGLGPVGVAGEKEEWRKAPVAASGALVLGVRDHRGSKGSLLVTHLQGWGCAEGCVQEEPGFVAWSQRPGVTGTRAM